MTPSLNNPLPLKANVVARKLFLHISDEWQLTLVQNRQLFSILSNQQYEAWMSGELNSEHKDLLTLVSYLIAIHKQLHQIFADPIQANAWISKPNREFQNRSCVKMIEDYGFEGAQTVLRHLENQLI